MARMKITPLVPLPLNNSTVKRVPKPIQHRDRSPVRIHVVRSNSPRLSPSKKWILRVRYVKFHNSSDSPNDKDWFALFISPIVKKKGIFYRVQCLQAMTGNGYYRPTNIYHIHEDTVVGMANMLECGDLFVQVDKTRQESQQQINN
jgi:hypothetical protein